MTSKNSFLISMKEDLKRRSWMLVLSFIGFFFAFPVRICLMLSTRKRWGLTAKQLQNELQTCFTGEMNLSITILAVTTVCALIFAVQGFSYLFHRNQVDLYHSVPVTKQKRFWVRYVDSIVIYIVPYLFNLVLTLLIGNSQHLTNGSNVALGLVCSIYNTILFLSVFNITLIAIMMTGNVVVSMLATGVFLGYEEGIRMINVMYLQEFTRFSTYGMDKLQKPIFSSLAIYYYMLQDTYGDQTGTVLSLLVNTGCNLLKMIVLLVISLGIAYALFIIRPSEAAGKAMAFQKSKSVVKFFLMVPIVLVSEMFFEGVSGGNTSFIFFGIAVGVILGHSIIEVIYEADLRAIKRRILCTIAAGIVATLIFCIYRLDWLQYNSFVPDAKEVESIAVLDYIGETDHYVPDEFGSMEYVQESDYAKENMFLTNTADICRFARENLENDRNNGTQQNSIFARFSPRSDDDENSNLSSMHVMYRLKNGAKIYRMIYFDPNEEVGELAKFIDTPEYSQGINQILRSDFGKGIGKFYYTYYNGIMSSRNMNADIDKLVDAYREDLNSIDYMTKYNEMPIGIVRFTQYLSLNDSYQWSYPVYPECTKTIEFMKNHDIQMDMKLTADIIMTINVDYYDYEMERQMSSTDDEALEDEEDFNVNMENDKDDACYFDETFTDKKDIEEILEAAYDSELYDKMDQLHTGTMNYYQNYHSVSITLDPNSELAKEIGSQYCLFWSIGNDSLPKCVLDAKEKQGR